MTKEYKCWWCSKKGDSGEHKFKKTDIIAEFGKDYRDDENSLVLLKGGVQHSIQGPNSRLAKFERVLCKNCNNFKSKEFDLTYTYVINDLIQNHKKYETTEVIDFKELFGANWKQKKINFISYYVKHFCCRLARNNVEIPIQIIQFLDKEIEYLEFINFDFQHKLDLKRLFNIMNTMNYHDGFLEFGKLMKVIRNNDEIEIAYTYLTRKWVRTEMYYCDKITKNLFPAMIEYYNSPLISYKSASILDLTKNHDYDEIVQNMNEYTQNRNVSKKDNRIREINEYFNLHAYK